MNNHTERLHNRFVRDEGKITLCVQTSELSPADWADIVDMWSEEICRHIIEDFESLLVCKFSTTTPTIRTASQVVMMNSFREYFDYSVLFICGIPEITVTGTVDDWCEIRNRVKTLSKYGLEWWKKRLLPICDGIIKTIQDRPSLRFWRQIYSPKEAYGGGKVTGWLADLFPYVNDTITKSPTILNPILRKPRAKLRSKDGIRPEAFPVGRSQAPFSLHSESLEYLLEVIGGFVGVTQDSRTKCLQPEIGWAIRMQNNFDIAINKLAGFHKKKRPDNWPKDLAEADNDPKYFLDGFRQDAIKFAERLGGGTLYPDSEHPWYVRSLGEHRPCQFAGSSSERERNLFHFMDLIDGRAVLYLWGSDAPSIVLGVPLEQVDRGIVLRDLVVAPQTTVEIAKSFHEFADRIFDAQGRYYFDQPGFIAERRFDDSSDKPVP